MTTLTSSTTKPSTLVGTHTATALTVWRRWVAGASEDQLVLGTEVW